MKINRIVFAAAAIFIANTARANGFSGIYRVIHCQGEFYSQFYQNVNSLPPKIQISADSNQFMITISGSHSWSSTYPVRQPQLTETSSGNAVVTSGAYRQNGNVYRYFMENNEGGSLSVRETFSAGLDGNFVSIDDERNGTTPFLNCLVVRDQ